MFIQYTINNILFMSFGFRVADRDLSRPEDLKPGFLFFKLEIA